MQKMNRFKNVFEWLLCAQDRLCGIFDRFLPGFMKRWGYRDFVLEILPGSLEPGLLLVDVGGGKRPVVDARTKERLNLQVIGLDISGEELQRAPQGCYDRAVVADICGDTPDLTADMVVALAVLEHVPDSGRALANIARMLKPGGKALIFVPGRNSIFARLNLLIPEKIKRALLKIFFRRSADQQGFKSYYDRCTPEQIRNMAQASGLEVEEELCYFQSAYFSIFLPLHVLYRTFTLFQYRLIGNEAAETFTLILRRRA